MSMGMWLGCRVLCIGSRRVQVAAERCWSNRKLELTSAGTGRQGLDGQLADRLLSMDSVAAEVGDGQRRSMAGKSRATDGMIP